MRISQKLASSVLLAVAVVVAVAIGGFFLLSWIISKEVRPSWWLGGPPARGLPTMPKPRVEPFHIGLGLFDDKQWCELSGSVLKFMGGEGRLGRTRQIAQMLAVQGLASPGSPAPIFPQAAVALGVAAFDAPALRLAPGDRDHAAKLYTAAKAERDGCIDYLRAGLLRRFRDEDPERIAKRIRAANDKLREFTRWADNKIKSGEAGPAGNKINPGEADPEEPLVDARERRRRDDVRERGHVREWLKEVSKMDEDAIKHLREEMEQDRLKGWGDL
jgi:hypothetical protein